MPLTMCPQGHGAMQEVSRAGVQLDICPNCGGVWLDRGELDKIQEGARDRRAEVQDEMRRFEQDRDEFRRDPQGWERRHPYDGERQRRRYDDDEDDGRRKRRRGLDIFDIFD